MLFKSDYKSTCFMYLNKLTILQYWSMSWHTSHIVLLVRFKVTPDS